MTNEEINKRVHELLGMCWHDEISEIWQECLTCHKYGDSLKERIDFTTSWESFGILWEWWQKQDNWGEVKSIFNHEYCWIDIISPRGLAEATVKFFKENE